MPIAALQLITVTGQYFLFDGDPAAGKVEFKPSVVLTDTVNNDIVFPSTLIATLDGTGSFSIAIPATTDPDLSPTGWTYTVTETISGAGLSRTYDIEVPHDAPGLTLDLADIVPATAVNEVSSYVLVSTFNNHVNNITDAHNVDSRIALSSNLINVMKAPYNAKGDGVTDDTAAINSALATGRPIFMPKGVYIVAGTLDWPSPNSTTFQPSPSLIGEGPLNTIIRKTGSGTVCNLTAPTVSGTGAYTSGTNYDAEISGIKFEGRPGQIAIKTKRYFGVTLSHCWFTKADGEVYGYDTCIQDERVFALGPPRLDDSNIGLYLDSCMFMNFDVGINASISSAAAHIRMDFCYFQGVTPSQMATIQGTYPSFVNQGAKLSANHITGTNTQFVSCTKGLWLARSGDTASIDRLPTAVTLNSWHFEGMRDADIYIDACRGLELIGCEFIDHNAVDVSWVPTSIYIVDGATNDVGSINVRGGFFAPSADATYGTNWRGVYAGTNFNNSGANYISIDSPFITQMVGAAAMVSTTAANASLVIEREGPKAKVSALSVRGWSVRQADDATARLSGRANGVAFGPGGVTAEDTLLTRSGEGLLTAMNMAGTSSGYVQAGGSKTSTDFATATNTINTIGKFAGKMAWDATSGRPVFANGGGSTAIWKYADGTTAYTPA